jgi:squalene cyclase
MSELGAVAARDAGIAFLVERQHEDGGWRDFLTLAGEGEDWPTAFIAAQLAAAGAPGAALDRAAEFLLRSQHSDGGWGYHGRVPTDADSTGWALLFLSAHASAETIAVEHAAAYLALAQAESGGIPTYAEAEPIRAFMQLDASVDLAGWSAPHVEVTATAGRALAALGADWREAALAAFRFVAAQQQPDGAWPSYWWTGPSYPTLQAAALARLLDGEAAIARAAAWAARVQCEDGGFADRAGGPASAFATANALPLLADGPRRARAAAKICTMQRSNGGWPGDASMRIPPPGVVEPSRHATWRAAGLGTGVMISDQHGLFTTAACVAALAAAR